MTTTEVKNAIGNAEQVTVTFTKKNGETRVMKCSRNFDHLAANSAETGYVAPTGSAAYDADDKGLVVVWDLAKKAWRSIIAANVISINA